MRAVTCAGAMSFPSRHRLTDLVDAVRVESDVILDLRHRFKWSLVSPRRIDGAISAGGNAVVGSVAFVGAIRLVFAARQGSHINIPTWNILNGGIGRLAKRQRIARVGDNLSADRNDDASGVCIDRNRVIRPGNLHRFIYHDLASVANLSPSLRFSRSSSPRAGPPV